MTEIQEKIFYEDSDLIKVTSARFVVGKETYPIANISSVKNRFFPPKRFGAICWAVIGLMWSCSVLSVIDTKGEGYDPTLGLSISAVFFYLAWHFYVNGGAKYLVALTTSGSEVKALESKDKEKIDNVVQALNDAIVFRN